MSEVFTIAPAPARALWFLAAIGALLLALLLLFAFFAYSSRATRFEISPEGLAIRGTLYGRAVPWSALEVDQASVVDLRTDADFRPRLRTNGLGLPGYRVGWFRMRRPGKGLLFVTDPTRVVALPTRDGYTLLLSAREPAEFIAALQRGASSSAR